MAEQKSESKDDGGRVHVVATFECVSNDKIEAFKTILRPVVAITNNEKGCIQYNIHQDKKNECLFQMIEEWECQSDLDNHLKGAHVAPLFGEKFKEIAKATVSFCKSREYDVASLSLIGTKLPSTDIFIFDDGPKKLNTDQLFNDKKVIVFAIPGAFTPTCQQKHAPSYVKLYDEFKKIGIDAVYCLAVNDPFTLNAFNKSIGGDGKIEIISDYAASFR
eukprot:UN01027